MARVVLLEIEDVLDLGAAEGIYRLRVVTHHAYIIMSLTELLQDEVLSQVGVLVLVDHNIVEPAAD